MAHMYLTRLLIPFTFPLVMESMNRKLYDLYEYLEERSVHMERKSEIMNGIFEEFHESFASKEESEYTPCEWMVCEYVRNKEMLQEENKFMQV